MSVRVAEQLFVLVYIPPTLQVRACVCVNVCVCFLLHFSLRMSVGSTNSVREAEPLSS